MPVRNRDVMSKRNICAVLFVHHKSVYTPIERHKIKMLLRNKIESTSTVTKTLLTADTPQMTSFAT